jgi:hypothetical protein
MSSSSSKVIKWSKEHDLALLAGIKKHGTNYAQILAESPILQARVRDGKNKHDLLRKRWKTIAEDKESEYAPQVVEIKRIWNFQPRGNPRWTDELKLELLTLMEAYGYDYAKVLSASPNLQKHVAHVEGPVNQQKRLKTQFYHLLHGDHELYASKAQEIREAQDGKKVMLHWTDDLEREFIQMMIENGRDFHAVLASSVKLSLFLSFSKDSKVAVLERKWKNLLATREQKHADLFKQASSSLVKTSGRVGWTPELDQELLDQLEDGLKQQNANVFKHVVSVSDRLRSAGERVKNLELAMRNRWTTIRDGGVSHFTATQRLQIEAIRRKFETHKFEVRRGIFDKDNPNNMQQIFLNAMEEALLHPKEPLFKQMQNNSRVLKEHTRSLTQPDVRLRGIYNRIAQEAHPDHAAQLGRIKNLLTQRSESEKLWTKDADKALLNALEEALKTSSSNFYQRALESSPLLTTLLSTKSRPHKWMSWRYSNLKHRFYEDYAAQFDRIEELKQARQALLGAVASHEEDDEDNKEEERLSDFDAEFDAELAADFDAELAAEFDAEFGNVDDVLDDLEELEWDSLESAAAAAAAAPSSSSEALSTKRSKRATESWQDYLWATSAADDLESL